MLSGYEYLPEIWVEVTLSLFSKFSKLDLFSINLQKKKRDHKGKDLMNNGNQITDIPLEENAKNDFFFCVFLQVKQKCRI